MDLDATTTVAAGAEAAYEVVADLTTYPRWLGIVRRVTPEATAEGGAADAWRVELGARVGPFWRTKTVRMIRTRHSPPEAVRFERNELDGRAHSPWVLDASVGAAADGSATTVAVHLHYGGSGWANLLEPVLRVEAARAGGRLAALLA